MPDTGSQKFNRGMGAAQKLIRPYWPRPLSVHLSMGLYGQGAADHGLLKKYIKGIQLYQSHPFQRPEPDYEAVHESGQARILRHKGAGEEGTPLLLIPSLINRSCIFDMLPDKSFMRFLAAQGFSVYLCDWGRPVKDPSMQTMEDVIVKKLVPAVNFLAQKHGHLNALGYCMGGTLLTAAAQFVPRKLSKMVSLASPWDFHAGTGRLRAEINLASASAAQIIESKSLLPVDWVQSVFAHVYADQTLEKFARFAGTGQNSERAKQFVAVEDWLNDGVDLPADVARCCIHNWYTNNDPARGRWYLGDQNIAPDGLEMPVLIVASERDRLVAAESAFALKKHIAHAECFDPDCGHISLMAGKNVEQNVWQPIAEWLASD